MAWLLEGKGPTEIAALVSTPKQKVSRQAVLGFKKRHEHQLMPLVAEVEKRIEDYAIAQKVNRIAGLDALSRQVQAWIDERGLMERSEITTENAVIVRERFAREVSSELRAIYRAAAEELGHLPKSEPGANGGVAVAVQVNLKWGDDDNA